MKTIYALLFLLPLVAWAQASNSRVDPQFRLLEKGMKYVLEALEDQKPFLEEEPSDDIFNPNQKNIILDPILNFIKSKLKYEIGTPPLGSPEKSLYVFNMTLTGLDATTFDLESPKFGLKIDNLTVSVPTLDVSSPEYSLKELDLGVVVLNGEGPLRIFLGNLKFYIKMDLSYDSILRKFTVISIGGLEFHLEESEFNLGNLGNGNEELSSLLNGIASYVLPKLIEAISTALQPIFDASPICKKNTNLELICGVIGGLINSIYGKMLG